MDRKTRHLIVISFDGLSTKDFDYISVLPGFCRYLKNASYCKNVFTVYPSLTYPAHTTIVTGKYPKNHGIINNTLLQPYRHSPDWYWQRKHIKGDTLYDAAIRSNMRTAALLWPVTAKSRIQYNLPEIFANRSWQNQIMVSIANGTPLYQLELNRLFGHIRKGRKQPELDDFLHQALLHTIKNKRPDLILAHYTDLDWKRHFHGFDSIEAKAALKRHDKRLEEILNTLEELNMMKESTLIILGDHSSLDEDKIISLNVLLKQKGFIEQNKKNSITDYSAIVKNCDGSAYVYLCNKNNKKLNNSVLDLLHEFNYTHNCIEKIYSSEEAEKLGADPGCAFMLEAAEGYYFADDFEGDIIKAVNPEDAGIVPHVTVNTHGYSPFKDNYTTMFMAAGNGIRKDTIIDKMNLVDEAPTMAQLLGLSLADVDGRILEEILI